MSSRINRALIRKHELEIGLFYFYKNFMVAEIKEGIGVSYENATEMLRLVKTYFGNTTPFVYISNRKESYSFNPTSHFKTVSMFPNLKGFAAVTYDGMNKEIAMMEQSFINVPTEIFNTVEEATLWVEEILILD